jgi:hypothetical protein
MVILQTCPHCKTSVLPKRDGRCPSCQEPVFPSIQDSKTSSTGSDPCAGDENAVGKAPVNGAGQFQGICARCHQSTPQCRNYRFYYGTRLLSPAGIVDYHIAGHHDVPLCETCVITTYFHPKSTVANPGIALPIRCVLFLCALWLAAIAALSSRDLALSKGGVALLLFAFLFTMAALQHLIHIPSRKRLNTLVGDTAKLFAISGPLRNSGEEMAIALMARTWRSRGFTEFFTSSRYANVTRTSVSQHSAEDPASPPPHIPISIDEDRLPSFIRLCKEDAKYLYQYGDPYRARRAWQVLSSEEKLTVLTLLWTEKDSRAKEVVEWLCQQYSPNLLTIIGQPPPPRAMDKLTFDSGSETDGTDVSDEDEGRGT